MNEEQSVGISVVHLTTVHSRGDTRIFLKECRSLAAKGHVVTLIVADGKGEEVSHGINVVDAGRPRGRIHRMTSIVSAALEQAIALDADFYHLHDPELLSIAGRLKRLGKTVVFDSHEDTQATIQSKPYLPLGCRAVVATLYKCYEAWICRRLDAVITATPFIRTKFLSINPTTVSVNNYPLMNELSGGIVERRIDKPRICYVGGISEVRGIREVVQAMAGVSRVTRLLLCGRFTGRDLRSRLEKLRGWEQVDYVGWLSREELRFALSHVVAGLVTFHPEPNHLNAQPNKMFEYMSAGIPVIASKFPLWQKIVEDNDCGVCVDPQDPEAIAEAISYLVGNSARAQEMGENGRKAVQDKYNWSVEEEKLLGLYEQLRNQRDWTSARTSTIPSS